MTAAGTVVAGQHHYERGTQQAKNLLVSHSAKKLGFFWTQQGGRLNWAYARQAPPLRAAMALWKQLIRSPPDSPPALPVTACCADCFDQRNHMAAGGQRWFSLPAHGGLIICPAEIDQMTVQSPFRAIAWMRVLALSVGCARAQSTSPTAARWAAVRPASFFPTMLQDHAFTDAGLPAQANCTVRTTAWGRRPPSTERAPLLAGAPTSHGPLGHAIGRLRTGFGA